MKIITFASLKGGSGKTTLSVFLAQSIQKKNLKVLLVDLDHNNNASTYSLDDSYFESIGNCNVYHVLSGTSDISQAIYPSKHGYDILPATPSLHKIGIEKVYDSSANFRFERLLRSLDYDIIVVDTPPSFGFELFCGLFICDLLISPIVFFPWVIQGYTDLEAKYVESRQALGKTHDSICIPSGIRKAEVDRIKMLDLNLTQTFIPSSVAIKKAEMYGKPLKEYSLEEDSFFQVAEEILTQYFYEIEESENVIDISKGRKLA